jgi:hypothetical protein
VTPSPPDADNDQSKTGKRVEDVNFSGPAIAAVVRW